MEGVACNGFKRCDFCDPIIILDTFDMLLFSHYCLKYIASAVATNITID